MDKLRVLVVDDHEEFRHSLESLLGAMDDVEVVGRAGDGRSAAELALTLQPDVVVMDLHMPELNGVDATARIVQSSPHISVLVLTMMRTTTRCSPRSGPEPAATCSRSATTAEIAARRGGGPGRGDLRARHRRAGDDDTSARAGPRGAAVPELTDREREVLGLLRPRPVENAFDRAAAVPVATKTVRNNVSSLPVEAAGGVAAPRPSPWRGTRASAAESGVRAEDVAIFEGL